MGTTWFPNRLEPRRKIKKEKPAPAASECKVLKYGHAWKTVFYKKIIKIGQIDFYIKINFLDLRERIEITQFF
jgi:hypothetical protein